MRHRFEGKHCIYKIRNLHFSLFTFTFNFLLQNVLITIMATHVVRTADFVKVMRHVISLMENATMAVLITLMETGVMVSGLGKRKHSFLHNWIKYH